jgi:uncharacterized alpha-E superfamily protein
MLSSTARNLFWMARYMERAENTARLLEASRHLSSIPKSYSRAPNVWESALMARGSFSSYNELHDDFDPLKVIAFMAFDRNNPNSIISCIHRARENARSVRTALTLEMWETLNGLWLDIKKLNPDLLSKTEFNDFLTLIKDKCLSFEGIAYRMLLRQDGYDFFNLGLYLERADNTARILDVKYHILLPEGEKVGGSLDTYQWNSLLRCVASLSAYHWVYKESITPWNVADLLLLHEPMPRSVCHCYGKLTQHLDNLARAYGKQGKAQSFVRQVHARFRNGDMNNIFQQGLHEYLSETIFDTNKLADIILKQYSM